MESDWSWEHSTLINELIQGMDVARKLKADLRTPSSVQTRDLLVQRILSSYEKALLILRWNASNSKSQSVGAKATAGLVPESPISVNGSPPRDDINDGGLNDNHESKKRKMMPKWMDQVRVTSESGLEGPHDDGYSWRKYGQKDILGAKYPRSYYRCTYRKTHSCWATKQVQRSDEDPTIFDITYRGRHACSQGNNTILPPKSPDNQEKPHNHNKDIYHGQPSQEIHTKFRNTLTVNTDNLRNEEMPYPFTFPSTSIGCMAQENHSLLPLALENNSFLGSLSQTHLLSPITPESNYFPTLSFKINEFEWSNNKPCSESDITDIISANTSAANSPILDFNFSLDPAEIDPNFPFDSPGFFSNFT